MNNTQKNNIHERFPEGRPAILFIGFGGLSVLAREAAEIFDEYTIDTAKTVAEGLQAIKSQTVFVQPVLLLPGVEYEKLREEVAKSGKHVVVGQPLLYSPLQVHELADILSNEYSDETVLFIGHGTTHPASALYGALGRELKKSGLTRSFLGVLEGDPSFQTVAKELQHSGARKLMLVPLLLTAGMHVREGILGEESASWRTRLENLGLQTQGVNRGLLDYPAVRRMFLASAARTFAGGENEAENATKHRVL